MAVVSVGQVTLVDQNDVVITNSVAPSNPTTGALWLDTSKTPNELKRYTGSSWVKASVTSATDINAYTKTEADGKVSTAVNAVQVGGRNLLPNSDFKKVYVDSANITTKHGNTYATEYGGYNGGVSNPTTSFHAHVDTDTFGVPVYEFNESDGNRGWKGIAPTISAVINQVGAGEFVFSFDAFATGLKTKLFGGFYYTKVGATSPTFNGGQFSLEVGEVNTWSRVSVSHVLNNDVDWSKDIRFYIYGYGFGTNSILYVKNFKLEKGNKATEWSPSVEDVATDIATAQTEAEKATKAISDMSSDNILTPVEKVQLKKEWAVMVAEKTNYEALATTYAITTEKTNYVNAYNALNTLLNGTGGYLLTMTVNTDLGSGGGATFRGKFDDYYSTKAILIKKINETARSLANTAQSTATTAQSTATTANNNATTANNAIADMSSDDKITPVEKVQLKKEWAVILAEKPQYEATATTYAITTEKTNYVTAYNNLNTALNGTGGYLLTMTTTTNLGTGGGATFRAIFDDYYDKKAILLKKINETGKQLADTAQGTANTANATATTANSTANTVKTAVDEMTADDKLSVVEKFQLKKEWDMIVAERTTIEASATTYAITTEKTNYVTAYNNLNTRLNGTGGYLLSLVTPTDMGAGGGASLRALYDDYFDKKAVLNKKITDTARSLAVSAQGTANTANSTAGTANSTATAVKDLTDGWKDPVNATLINAKKINVTELSAITANLGTVTAGTITGVTINSANLNLLNAGNFKATATGLGTTFHIKEGLFQGALGRGTAFYGWLDGDLGDYKGFYGNYGQGVVTLIAGSVNLDTGAITESTRAHLNVGKLSAQAVAVAGSLSATGSVSATLKHTNGYLIVEPYDGNYTGLYEYGQLFFDGKTNYWKFTSRANSSTFNTKLSASAFDTTSSIKYKENVQPFIVDALSTVKSLDVKTYNLIGADVTERRLGLIIEEGVPEPIVTKTGDTVDTYAMVSFLWKAVQQLSQQVDYQQQSIEYLAGQLESQQTTTV